MRTKTKKQKLGPNQRRWIKALRSGRYKQGKHVLRRGEKHCCLGVGCRIFRLRGSVTIGGKWRYEDEPDTNEGAPVKLQRLLAIRGSAALLRGTLLKEQGALASANDSGVTFAQIADFCEAHPEAVFTEAK